jgi:hypothetical protein
MSWQFKGINIKGEELWIKGGGGHIFKKKSEDRGWCVKKKK